MKNINAESNDVNISKYATDKTKVRSQFMQRYLLFYLR